ncbi:MAG: metal-dependent transcriptional regulator [Spirochaetaceae bacterium]|nr:metal-dependent transcriptional regulator [Spirochaetaceae bacterium]
MAKAQRSSSATANEYLIQTYLMLRERRPVVGARIAERIGVSAAAVSQALKRLEQRKLLVLDPDDGVQLTRRGARQAERTIRRHYLLERLLVDELGFDWVDVDEEADKLEHSLSPRLEEHLFERLGRPTTCPHGNPFPGSPDERRLLDAPRLTTVHAGERTSILRITEEAEENEELMRRLDQDQLVPGTPITVSSISEAEVVFRKDATGQEVALPTGYARYVRVDSAN